MKINKIQFFISTLALAIGMFFPIIGVDAAIFEPGFEVETIASGLVLPGSMAFAPDGRIFIGEKGGTVRVIKDGVLLANPMISLSDVNTFGDRGLLSIVLDPNFTSNGYMYLSYTYENSPGSNFSGEKTGRIVRVTVVGDIADESSKVVLVGSVGGNATTPSCEDFVITADCIPSDSMSHSVGGLRFGPDGYLYATLGDGSNFDNVDPRALRAQNLDSLAGKIIRINTDGTAPSSNPFYDGNPTSNRSKVFAYGLRNAFRLNFHPVTGALFAGDVGWSDWEEVNVITSGANFGWPCREGAANSTYNCEVVGSVDPAYAYEHDSNGAGAIVVGAFPMNGVYPVEYNNSLFIGDYAQNWIKRAVVDSNNNILSVHDFMDNPDGPVDVSTGPDGNIYFISIYSGELHRLTHTSGNRRPVVQISANPTSGLFPLTVNFSSVGSNDPDSDPLTYSWNFGDGTLSTDENPIHTYNTNGNFIASLTLTDIHGSEATKSLNISVGNQKPLPQIVSPASGYLYAANQTINLVGSATDIEDGTLPPSAFNWQIILHHNTHIHIIQEFNGVTNPSFIGPDHGSSDVYIEVKLTVTDSGGLSETRSTNLYLNAGNNSGNLINNPSLEVSDGTNIPFGWVKGGYGVNNAVFTYPVAGFEGAKAAKLDLSVVTDGDAKWFFSPVFVTPLEKYNFSNYYTSNTESSQVAQYGFQNGTYQYEFLGTLPAASTPTKVTREIIMPANVQTFTLFHGLSSEGTLTVDDYSLTLATTTVINPPPAASSTTFFFGGFETNSFSEWTSVSGSNFTISGGTCRIGPDSNIKAVKITGATTPHDQILLKSTSTVGYDNLSISFCYKWDALEAGDGVAIEYTADGSTWNLLKDINNSTVRHMMYAANDTEIATSNGIGEIPNPIPTTLADLATMSIQIPANASNNPLFGLRLREHLTDGDDYVWLDDFQFRGVATTSSPIVPPPATTTNLILNPSLETAGTPGNPENWAQGGWGTNNRVFTYPVAGLFDPATGLTVGKAARVDITSYTNGDAKWYFTDVPVTGASLYDFRYAYSSNTNTNLTARYTKANGSIEYVGLGNYSSTSPASNIAGTLFTPADAVSVTLFHSLVNVGFLEVDNYSLTTASSTPPPPPPATTTNLILNPSLETAGTPGNPENWAQGGWGTNNRVFTYPVTGSEGVKGAKVEITSYTNGDAKWYFSDVPVTAGSILTFSHSYKSNVQTNLTIRYKKIDGSFQYTSIGNLAAASSWTNNVQTLVVPVDVISLTAFHSLVGVGTLEVDNYSLTTGASGTFMKGMVSLTFDDGWLSHYTSALPILNSANKKGVFYIISEETRLAASDERIQNPSLETPGTNGDPTNWFRGGWGTNNRVFTYPVAGVNGASAAKVEVTSYTSGDAKWYFGDATVIPNQNYVIKNSYNSTAGTEVVVRYTSTTGVISYSYLAGLPSTNGAWQNFERVITIPSGTASLTLFHILPQVGSLTVDNYSLKRVQVFVDPSQMLELQSSGHEIGSHTRTHPDLVTLSHIQKHEEIGDSKTDLIGMGIIDIATIAYPYGSYDAEVKDSTFESGYIGGRSVDRGYNTKDTDKFALKIQQISRTTTLAEVQGWINQAEIDKTWLILMFHQIDADMTADLGATPAFLQGTVDYLGTKNVDVVTVKEGILQMNP